MGKIAWMFSGPGAQYTGLGKSLSECSPAARAIFDMAENLRPGTLQQCFSADKETLSVTRNTQPCLFCVDLAAACALAEKGGKADFLAGFSLGEIPALAFGGYLSYKEAFSFVCRRAQEMDRCALAHPGAMYAVVKLSAEKVRELCQQFSECWPVNYNSPAQTVVACCKEVGRDFSAAVKAAGGKALSLSVSGAFHSPFMKEAAQELTKAFSNLHFSLPHIPVMANLTGCAYEGPGQMFEQVCHPVQWQKTVEGLADKGVDTFVEVGAGKTLSGLTAKILPQATVLNVQDAESLTYTWEVLSSC